MWVSSQYVFNIIYQSLALLASLAEIRGNLLAKTAQTPPLRRNGVNIASNLLPRKGAEFFFKWA